MFCLRAEFWQAANRASSTKSWQRWGQRCVVKVDRRCLSQGCPLSKEEQRWSYVHGVSDTPLLGATIGKMLQKQTEKHPDKDAAVFYQDGERLSFAELLHQADRFAAGLLSLGLKKGDPVGMWSPNCREWVVTQYGTARAGLILVNVNPQYRKHELQYALKKVGCKALVAAPRLKDLDYYEMLFDIMPELASSTPGHICSHNLPELGFLIMTGKEKYRGAFNFDDVLDIPSIMDVSAIMDLQNSLQFDDPINIQFTSGTTGSPKGATLTHHNIINNSYFVGRRLDYHNRESRVCNTVPLYHCFGMVLGCLQVPCHGATMVFPSKIFDAGVALKAAQDERCTSLYGVPTMFIDMLNHPTLPSLDLSTLYTGIMAGSPCPIEVMRKVMEKLHMTEVTVCYGSTETSPVSFQTMRESSVDKRVSTIGCASEHVEAKVVDENGAIVPVGVTGELWTRGYNTMLGYWGDHDRTTQVITPGHWYKTGDQALIDKDGYCRIVGRLKDLVIRGGENIYPTEIEQILYEHPKVKDVQVIGVPDERLGEEVCAWVQRQVGETVTEAELKAYCKERMARFKIPRYWMFVDGFPMTVTGKIQKFKMREESSKMLGLEHLHPH